MTENITFLHFGEELPYKIPLHLSNIPRKGESFIYHQEGIPPGMVTEVGHEVKVKDDAVLHYIHIHLQPDL